MLYEDLKIACLNLNSLTKHKKNKYINDFKSKWIEIMALCGLYNKKLDTYSLNNINICEYGISSDIYIVPSLNFNKLEEKITILEENLGCKILFIHKRNSPWIKSKFIFCPKDDLNYKVVKLKYPYEIYIGNDYSGEPIIVDINKYVHILESGGTRSGKSVQQSVILTNSIANFSPDELNLYLIQIAKSDLILFKNCEHTKAFASNVEEALTVLKYLVKVEMPRRNKIIEPYRECAKASNYKDYNKIRPDNKIVLTFVVFDEMSSLYQEKNKTQKQLKEEIIFYADEIARYGASIGIVLCCSLQKPTRDNLSPMLKSQCTTVISFRQNNSVSSQVAIDDSKVALGLEARQFVYRLASKDVEYGIVPWVKDTELQKILKKYKKPHRTLFDDLEKLNHRYGIKKHKELIEVGTHFKTEQEILEENIKKINNYVPYDQNNKILIENRGRRKIK